MWHIRFSLEWVLDSIRSSSSQIIELLLVAFLKLLQIQVHWSIQRHASLIQWISKIFERALFVEIRSFKTCVWVLNSWLAHTKRLPWSLTLCPYILSYFLLVLVSLHDVVFVFRCFSSLIRGSTVACTLGLSTISICVRVSCSKVLLKFPDRVIFIELDSEYIIQSTDTFLLNRVFCQVNFVLWDAR